MKQVYLFSGKIRFLIGLFFSLPLSAFATHIVGGELELQQLSGQSTFTHRINLNLYFDELNGNAGAEDPTATIYIFRKGDNAYLGTVELPQVESHIISYTKPKCAIPTLVTRLIRYGRNITFNTAAFNDPRGYYMVWERCCRNNIINNIQNPGGAGSTFYLEFAPLQGPNGNEIPNSSPLFRPLKGDYICINQPFSSDFGASDPDGDSLVFRLVTPYNGFSTAASPRPAATPSSAYPEVRWSSGINLSNIIPGSSPLQINPRTGLLTVTPNQIGLYVFSVEVEEYRRIPGAPPQRMGSVRRDFQFKVIDCRLNNPPTLLIRPRGQTDFYQEGSVLTLSSADASCIDLFITDKDANQRITVTTVGNLSSSVGFMPNEVLIQLPNDTTRSQVCFGKCLALPDNKPVTIALIARDEGCPQGLTDTLRIRLQLPPETNRPSDVVTTLPGNHTTLMLGDTLTFQVNGMDPDQDSLTLEAIGQGFVLTQAGIHFPSIKGKGTVQQTFQWIPQCTQLTNEEYVINFVVSEKTCNGIRKNMISVRIKVIAPPNTPPTIRTTLTQPVIELTLGKDTFIRFDVIGEDAGPNQLTLSISGVNFDPKAVGMLFEGKTGRSMLVAPYSWQPTCAILKGKTQETFSLDFINQDNQCPARFDTTRVTLVIKDLVVDYDISIPNAFTPNGDKINDFFSVPHLPQNTCFERFMRVDIFNRWGKIVYSSTNREFKWDGGNLPAGQYYYSIQYTSRNYKGWLTILR